VEKRSNGKRKKRIKGDMLYTKRSRPLRVQEHVEEKKNKLEKSGKQRYLS
jgi:hypothetical protein